MKEITVKVYDIVELKEANKKAFDTEIQRIREFLDSEYCNERVWEAHAEYFGDCKNSKVDIQWSLYTQGSGVNVYGSLATKDLKDFLIDHLTTDQIITLDYLADANMLQEYIELPYNNSYTYCKAEELDLFDLVDYGFDLWEGYEDYLWSALAIKDLIINKLNEISKKVSSDLYDLIDNMNSYAEDMAIHNDYGYLLDGTLINN